MTNYRSRIEISRLKYVESGRYSCEAENIAGVGRINYDVIIQKPPNIQGMTYYHYES